MRKRIKSKRVRIPKYAPGKDTIDLMLQGPATMQGSYASVGNPGEYTWDYPEATDGVTVTPWGAFPTEGAALRAPRNDGGTYDPNAPFEMVNSLVFGAPFALYDTADQALRGTYGTSKAETPAQNLMGKVAMGLSPTRWAESARQGVVNQRWVSPWNEENVGIMGDPNLSNTMDMLLMAGMGNSTRVQNAKASLGAKLGNAVGRAEQAAVNATGRTLARVLNARDRYLARAQQGRTRVMNASELGGPWDAEEMVQNADGTYETTKGRPQLDYSYSGDDLAKAYDEAVANSDGVVRRPEYSPEHTIVVEPSTKQKRLLLQKPTYQLYNGPKHSVSEVVNNDGSVNLKKLMLILTEALQNIPEGRTAQHRLENPTWHKTDWNTFLHTRDAYNRARQAHYPNDLLFSVLMHDAGKLWAGDGHGPYGASIVSQMFPDATKEQISGIYNHMNNIPNTGFDKLVKGADIAEPNEFRVDFWGTPEIKSFENTNVKNIPYKSYWFVDDPYKHFLLHTAAKRDFVRDARRNGEPVAYTAGPKQVGSGYNRYDAADYARLRNMRDAMESDVFPGDRISYLGDLNLDNKFGYKRVNDSRIDTPGNSYLSPYFYNGAHSVRTLNPVDYNDVVAKRYLNDIKEFYYHNRSGRDDVKSFARALYNNSIRNPNDYTIMYNQFYKMTPRASDILRDPVADNLPSTAAAEAFMYPEYYDNAITRKRGLEQRFAENPQIETFKDDDISYNEYGRGFDIGRVFPSNDIYDAISLNKPDESLFLLSHPYATLYAGTKSDLGGYYDPDTDLQYIDTRYIPSINDSDLSLDGLNSTFFHEGYSHPTDNLIQDWAPYDISDIFNNYNLDNDNSKNPWETRATMNEVKLAINKNLEKPGDREQFRKAVGNLSDEELMSMIASTNGYGYDYFDAYNELENSSVSSGKPYVDKLRSMLFLPSVGTPGMPYFYDPATGKWDTSTLGRLAAEGRDEFHNWIDSPEYKQAASENKKEAESMGLGYTPTYEKANYSKKHPILAKPLGNTGIGGITDGNRDITLNLMSSENPKDVIAHEAGHASDHGNVAEELMATNPEQGMKEWKYLKYKASQVFKPDSEYGGKFDLSEHAPEAAMNARDFGKELGLKIGQPYPGYEKALLILKSYPKNGYKSGLIDMFKTDRESMPYVWKALTGVQFGVAALLYLNRQDDDK